MENPIDSTIITSYTELENAIRNATRRYFLARNPQYTLESEIDQMRIDNLYSPGFFHGETGNLRALNTLMYLHDLTEDKNSEQYKTQLTQLLFAIIEPLSSSLGRSEWLATILANTLIQGSFSTLMDRKKIIARRVSLASPVFSKTALASTLESALMTIQADTGSVTRYDKLQGVHAILLFMHAKLTEEQKKIFNEQVGILKAKLAQPHKIDVTEIALSYRAQHKSSV